MCLCVSVWRGGNGNSDPAPQDFLSILHQVYDTVIKVSVFPCFLATAVTIKKKNNNKNPF